MPIEIMEVDSVSCFVNDLEDIINSSRDRKFVYRGQSEAKWALIPTVQRSLKNNPQREVVDTDVALRHEEEKKLLDDFKRFARPYIDHLPKTEWEWLALAQHYKLPTRFLDWTEHAGTALFFAVEDCEMHGSNGAVWCSELPEDVCVDTSPYDVDAIKLYRPPHIIKRITLQKGCFTVHPTDYLIRPYGWPGRLIKFIIPGGYKAAILHDLLSFGVNRATIFGDLDSIAAEIRRDKHFDCNRNCNYRNNSLMS